VLVALCVWIVYSSGTFQECIQQNHHPGTYQDFEESITKVPRIIGVYRLCTGTFIHKNSEIIIAAFTVIVGVGTIFLWAATRALVCGTERVSQTQLRAFIFAKGFEQATNVFTDRAQPYIKEYVFWSKIENVGLTTATDVKIWILKKILPTSEDREPNFEWRNEGTSAVIGPRGIAQTSFVTIPLENMIELWEHRVEIYLATRIEYRDMFNPSVVHHHEQCAILDLLRHPADVENDTKNLPRVMMRGYGRENSAA